MMIVQRVKGKIMRTVLCMTAVHSDMHADISSS